MSAMSQTTASSLRGRIGCDVRSGHYAVPHRYRLHLSLSCPTGLEIAVTHSLLGLHDVLPVSLLPAVPDGPGDGYAALRPLYEASSHQHPGPAAAPVLSDGWTGRIVSTHAPDILRDLAERFGGEGPELYPHHARYDIEEIGRLCEQDISDAAHSASGGSASAARPTERRWIPCSCAGVAGEQTGRPRPRTGRRGHRCRRPVVGDARPARHRAPVASGRRSGTAHRRPPAVVVVCAPARCPSCLWFPPRPGRHRAAASCALPGPGVRRGGSTDRGLDGGAPVRTVRHTPPALTSTRSAPWTTSPDCRGRVLAEHARACAAGDPAPPVLASPTPCTASLLYRTRRRRGHRSGAATGSAGHMAGDAASGRRTTALTGPSWGRNLVFPAIAGVRGKRGKHGGVHVYARDARDTGFRRRTQLNSAFRNRISLCGRPYAAVPRHDRSTPSPRRGGRRRPRSRTAARRLLLGRRQRGRGRSGQPSRHPPPRPTPTVDPDRYRRALTAALGPLNNALRAVDGAQDGKPLNTALDTAATKADAAADSLRHRGDTGRRHHGQRPTRRLPARIGTRSTKRPRRRQPLRDLAARRTRLRREPRERRGSRARAHRPRLRRPAAAAAHGRAQDTGGSPTAASSATAAGAAWAASRSRTAPAATRW